MGAVPARDTFFCIAGGLESDNPRPDFFTFSTLFPMSDSESKLTPAQVALLDFISHIEAGDIFNGVSLTLRYSLHSFAQPDFDSHPAPIMFDAWQRTMELMERIHAISVESRPKG